MENSIYYLLGHIDNYSGGFSSSDGVFKRTSLLGFDWKISDEKVRKSERLLKKCAVILEEYKLPNDIRVEKWEENKGMTIYSKNIVDLVDIFIGQKSEWLGRDQFEINKDLFDEFEWQDTDSNSHKQRLNFLSGVMDSNAIENKIYFYNGYDKCLLTHHVLRCFADEDDHITLSSHFRTPYVDIIEINKEGPLWKRILKRPSSK